MSDLVGTVPPTARLKALESWRAAVLRGMLKVATFAAPMLVVVALVFRSGAYPWPGILALCLVSVGFPLLRFAPRLSLAARARLTVTLCFLGGLTALSTFGYSSAAGIALSGTAVLSVVFLGRRAGLLMIGLAVLSYVVVGLLNARHILTLNPIGLDPRLLKNWIRIGLAFAGLAALLTTAIDYVIRHVEHSSRAAMEALGDLRLAYERLALLHERLDAAKEEERRFIAGELHDDLGQILTVIKLRLKMGDQMGDHPGMGGPETLELVDQAIDRVRKISRDLRPPALDQIGLMEALRDHVRAQAALSGVPIDLTADDDSAERLPPALEIACFRIVQESLTNALRHASASRIRVRVDRCPAMVVLEIADDGRGFDSAAPAQLSAQNLGILGMQERVRSRGGSFRITSEPNSGTRVQVELPIAA